MRAARARRQINADDRQVREVGLQVAALEIELVVAEPCRDPRRALRIKRDAAVALALRRVERRVRSARRGERARNIAGGAFDFLQADDVPRLDACEPSRKALAFG